MGFILRLHPINCHGSWILHLGSWILDPVIPVYAWITIMRGAGRIHTDASPTLICPHSLTDPPSLMFPPSRYASGYLPALNSALSSANAAWSWSFNGGTGKPDLTKWLDTGQPWPRGSRVLGF